MEVKVNASAVVYANIKLQTGDQAVYFPTGVGGKTTTGGLIDLLGSYSLRGPQIVHGWTDVDTTPRAVGLAAESFVIVEEVPYSKADPNVLKLSGNTYVPM